MNRYPVGFGILGPCNRHCSYCGEPVFEPKWDKILEDFDYCCQYVFRGVLKIQPILWGGEISYWPKEIQLELIEICDRYAKDWIILTNGYDWNSPIMTHYKRYNYHVCELDADLTGIHDCVVILDKLENWNDCKKLLKTYPKSGLAVKVDDRAVTQYLEEGKREWFDSYLDFIGVTEKELILYQEKFQYGFCPLGPSVLTNIRKFGYCYQGTASIPIEKFTLTHRPQDCPRICMKALNLLLNKKFYKEALGQDYGD